MVVGAAVVGAAVDGAPVVGAAVATVGAGVVGVAVAAKKNNVDVNMSHIYMLKRKRLNR